MINEYKSYRWAENKPNINAKEEPKKAMDHAMDECRYFIMSEPGPFEPVHEVEGYWTPEELADYGEKTIQVYSTIKKETGNKRISVKGGIL